MEHYQRNGGESELAMILEKEPQFIIKGGKPSGVILDINDYTELLERLEDTEDLAELNELRKRPLKFMPFEEFLGELKNV